MLLMYISTLVLGIITRKTFSALQPKLTIITLHETKKVTWKVANETCTTLNQSLLTIKTPEKKKQIINMDRNHFNNHTYDTQYWVGLKAERPGLENCSDTSFIWVDDNSKSEWGDYFPGEPNDCDVDFCIRIHDLLLRTRDCEKKYAFICEEVFDECTFEAFNDSIIATESLSLISSTVITLQTNSLKSSCLETCLNSIVEGAFCQAVTMNVISCECVLLFSNYTRFENVRMDVEADHVTYVKQCLLISKEQVPRVPYVDVCHPSSNICSTLNPSVTTSIDTTSAVVTTTGSSDPGTTATNTTATCAPTNETANSMPISHLDRSSCAINISWELPANANISLIMQNVALLKQELETMKNNTSRYKRRKVSWPDDRVVSKSLGGLGVSILVFLFLLIVLSDVRAFKASKAVMSDMT